MEETRILREYSKEELDHLYKKKKILFDYDQVKTSYDSIVSSLTEKIKPIEEQEPNYTKFYKIVSDSIGKQNLTLKDLESYKTSNEYLKQCIAFVKYYYYTGYPYNEFMDFLDYKRKSLEVCMNLEYDNRILVEDEPYNPKIKNYGSPFVDGNINSINHGTEVAGIVADSLRGHYQKNLLKFKIMPIVVTGIGDSSDKDLASAIIYATNNGAKVINISQTKTFSLNDKIVDKALKYAQKHDVLIVKSAGNETLDLDKNIRYPNDIDKNEKEFVDNMIVVGASGQDVTELMRYSSNYGNKSVDIFAPSTNINTLLPNNNYLTDDGGTSYATPLVVSVAALIRAYFPDLSASQVKQVLMDSGTAYEVDVTITKDDDSEIIKPFSSLSKSGKIVNAYNAFLMAENISKTK